ncbi:hypothetical protein [Oleisolibacter albus]|uniref:hypothetical protein n=1 Tax=Oleisolibacter albus TaxID=2171757 RepID=UPI000DF3FD14|nr:hypothetical protein [Oleisolibacter albus]
MTSMTQMTRVGAILAASLLLSACQTDADPSKGGFLSGVQGITSGGYEQRLQDKQQSLENAQDQQVQRQREVERLTAQQQAVARQRTQAEQKLAALNSDLDKAQAKLSTARKDTSKLKQQVESLKKRIALAEQNPYLDDGEKARQLETLRKEKEALEQEVDLAVKR